MNRTEYNAMRAEQKAAGKALNAAVVQARRDLRKQEAARRREAAEVELRRKAEERAESSHRRQADARALVLTLVRGGRAAPPVAPPDGQLSLDVGDAPDVAGYALSLANLVAKWPVSRSMLDRAIEQLCASGDLIANRERDHSTTLIIPRSLAAV